MITVFPFRKQYSQYCSNQSFDMGRIEDTIAQEMEKQARDAWSTPVGDKRARERKKAERERKERAAAAAERESRYQTQQRAAAALAATQPKPQSVTQTTAALAGVWGAQKNTRSVLITLLASVNHYLRML
jgi:hypothetical protein